MHARRLDDANRLLHELAERAGRGEYVPAHAALFIYVGLGDVPAIRRTLAKAIEESLPPLALKLTCGELLLLHRSDPEINRMLSDHYGW